VVGWKGAEEGEEDGNDKNKKRLLRMLNELLRSPARSLRRLLVVCAHVYTGNKQVRTSVKSATLNPEWEEQFEFTVSEPDMQALSVDVFDKDRFTEDDKLGSCVRCGRMRVMIVGGDMKVGSGENKRELRMVVACASIQSARGVGRV
jgi:hypothetical protein